MDDSSILFPLSGSLLNPIPSFPSYAFSSPFSPRLKILHVLFVSVSSHSPAFLSSLSGSLRVELQARFLEAQVHINEFYVFRAQKSNLR
jgi:hypothetical protein